MSKGLKRFIWILNTCGFLFYLAWLSTMGDRQLLREQDGIIYFLPVIPFFFVYILLVNPTPRPPADAAASGSPADRDRPASP